MMESMICECREYIRNEIADFMDGVADVIQIDNPYVDLMVAEKIFRILCNVENAKDFLDELVRNLYEQGIGSERISSVLQDISMSAAVLDTIAEAAEDDRKRYQKIYDLVYSLFS